MGQFVVRPYRPEDRDAVRRVCFETGLMGGPIATQYRDFESFADMFTSYYTDVEPQHALVAELDGKVVGYLLSAIDSRKAWSPMRIALKHVLTRGVCFRPGTAGFYFRSTLDMIRDFAAARQPKFEIDKFPSHTHNNLLLEARGHAVGKQSFFELFDMLKLAGSPGLHGECLSDNEPMLKFATTKLGYKLIGEPYPVPGMRYPDGRRAKVWLGLRDLSDWVPGAWREEQKAQKERKEARGMQV